MKVNSISPRVAENLFETLGNFRKTKPLHDRDGRLQCTNKEKNQTSGNGNGQFWAPIEIRKRRHLSRMDHVKIVQNHEYHVSQESR